MGTRPLDESIEAVGSTELKEAYMPARFRAAALTTTRDADQSRANRREELIKEMKRLDIIFQKGRIDEKSYLRQIDALDAEVQQIEAVLKIEPAEAASQIRELTDAWTLAKDDRGMRAEILKTLLREVYVDSDRGEVVRWVMHEEFALFERT